VTGFSSISSQQIEILAILTLLISWGTLRASTDRAINLDNTIRRWRGFAGILRNYTYEG
jgi:hypothetical protein